MKSLVIEAEKGLLFETIKLAKKEELSLSEYVANLIDKHVKSEKGELDCPSQGICLVALSKYADLKQTLEGLEKQMIIRALAHTDYIQTDAARLLGIGKSGLNQKMNKYNLKIPNTGRIKQIGENPHRGFLNINDFKQLSKN